MKIGIDGSRAFVKERTGIEEYSYQVIKHLAGKLDGQVVLYVNSQVDGFSQKSILDLGLPGNWIVKDISLKYLWTQVGLAWEMVVDPVDTLFVPAHTVPWIHPRHTVVTVHGLEYEHCPESYPFFSRLYHHFFVTRSCRWSSRIIAVSQNTKKDLTEIYRIGTEKVTTIYNGYEADGTTAEPDQAKIEHLQNTPYWLYVGRLEKRKNIEGIVQAFDIFKNRTGYSGRLVLAGKPGCGYQSIKDTISSLKSRHDIIEAGFVEVAMKWSLMAKADIFLFPSLCEGFGLPILEAQNLGTPVITSKLGPMDEVAGNKDILVDPYRPDQIAELANRMINDKEFRAEVIDKGRKNISRFSWEDNSRKVAQLLTAQQ